MNRLHRIGDLVSFTKSYNPTVYYICKVIDIIDTYSNSHNEYNIITGQGDKNSKVNIKLKAFAYFNEYKIDINYLDKPIIFNKNPHDIYLKYPEKEINNCLQKIESMKKNIEFFNKHKNRKDKLNEILI